MAIGIPLLIYTLLNQRRKNRFSSLARQIQGKYIHAGFFKPGKIVGHYEAKQFSVEPFTASGGKGSSYRTAINVECKYDKEAFVIQKDFFKNFQDWKYVFKLGQRTEKVFFWTLNLKNVYIPIDENGKLLLQQVLDNLAMQPKEINSLMTNKTYFPGSLHIARNNVRMEIGGVIQDENKIKNNLYDK